MTQESRHRQTGKEREKEMEGGKEMNKGISIHQGLTHFCTKVCLVLWLSGGALLQVLSSPKALQGDFP